MRFITYFSYLIIPMTICCILSYGLIKKKKLFDIFLEGAREGIGVVLKICPTIIGIFAAIGALRASGVIDIIIKLTYPVASFLGMPKEIMPLAILRPISRKCFSSNWNRHYEYIWC